MELVDVARERADVGSGAVGAVNEQFVGVSIERNNVEMLGSASQNGAGPAASISRNEDAAELTR